MYTRIILSILFVVSMAYPQYNLVIKRKGTGTSYTTKIDCAGIESISFEKLTKTGDYIEDTKTFQILDKTDKPINMAKVYYWWEEGKPTYTCSDDLIALNGCKLSCTDCSNLKLQGYTNTDGKVTLTIYRSKKTYISGGQTFYCSETGYIRCDKGTIAFVAEINGVYVYRLK